MPLIELLSALSEGRRAELPAPRAPFDEEFLGDPEHIDALLDERARHAAAELAHTAPPLDRAAARWGATLLLRGAQGLVHRALGAAELEQLMRPPAPPAETSALHWSVDLCLRHLPELARLASGIASDDPLSLEFARLAAAWPLSAVGMGADPVAPPEAVLAHPGLAQLYVDRILARDDLARLDEPRVRELALASLGGHPELAPAAAAHLGVTSAHDDPSPRA